MSWWTTNVVLFAALHAEQLHHTRTLHPPVPSKAGPTASVFPFLPQALRSIAESDLSKGGFKPSRLKRDSGLACVPVNLQLNILEAHQITTFDTHLGFLLIPCSNFKHGWGATMDGT